MDFQNLIKERYSVRSYKSDPVPEEVLEAVLEAGRLAPTAANRQGFTVYVIKTEGRKESLLKIYSREWFSQAPLVLAVCVNPSKCWVRMDNKNYSDVDAAIVMDHMILAAADKGLGTCWIGAFNAEAAREVLGLTPDTEPVVFTPLGYATDNPKPKTRKQVSDLIRYL